ncbi:restin homolog isoform X9 [Drosophila grimshawi]|uniref:restin homolog isoform X9 n=1 Tax=Drosophila grimshawi TaxID=7222 RepID=UPI001C9322F7|nr:restin homolog isoform X9 [Drosophila grimshawi]
MSEAIENVEAAAAESLSPATETDAEMPVPVSKLKQPSRSNIPTPASSASSVTGMPTKIKPPSNFGSTGSVSKIGRPCCNHTTPKSGPPPRDTNSMSRESDDNLSSINSAYTDHNSTVLTANTEQFIIGQRVWVGGLRSGQIAYIGETHFAPGDWAGIVLDEPNGKNDGCVSGKRYFQCEPKRGIFSRLTRLTTYPLSGAMTPTSPLAKNSPERSRTGSPTASVRSSMLRSPGTGKNGLTVGDRVIVSSGFGSRPGILRYLGETQFAPGNWCGVELDEGSGKNDGAVDGIRYFECKPRFGVFVPIAKVSLSPSTKKTRLSRTGSRESLTSIGTMNSIATTNTSRIRMNAQRKSSTPLRSIVATPKSQFSMQDLLREKQQHVEQLMVERELDREDSQNQALQLQKNINEVIIFTDTMYVPQPYADRRRPFRLLPTCHSSSRTTITNSPTTAATATTTTKPTTILARQQQPQREQRSQPKKVWFCDKKKLFPLKTRIVQLESQLGDERKKSEELQFTIDEAQFCGDEMNAQSQVYKEKIHDLEKKITKLVSATPSLQSLPPVEDNQALANAQAQIAELQEKLSAQEKQSEARLAESLEEEQRLRENIDYLKSESDTLKTELLGKDESLEKFSLSQCGIENLRHELALLKEENEKQSQQIQAKFEQQLAEKEQQLAEKEKQLTTNQEQLQQVSNELSKLKSKSDTLENERENVTDECEILHTEIRMRDEQIRELNQQLDELTTQLNVQKADSSALDEMLNAQQSQNVDSKTQLEQFQVELQQLKTANETVLKEKAAMEQQMEQELGKLRQQTQELLLASGDSKSQNLQLSEAKVALEKQLEALQQSGEAQLQASQAEIVNKEQQLRELEKSKEQLQQQLEQQTKLHEQLIASQQELQQSQTKQQAEQSAQLAQETSKVVEMEAKLQASQLQLEQLLQQATSSGEAGAQQLAQLQAELSQVQAKEAEVKSALNAQLAELQAVQQLTQSQQATIVQQTEQLDATKIQSAQFELQLKESNENGAQRVLELGDVKRQNAALLSKCEALQQQQDALQQELVSSSTGSSQLQAQLKQLNEELLVKQQSYATLESQSSGQRLELASDNELLQQTKARLELELQETQLSRDKHKSEAEHKQMLLAEQEQLSIQQELALGDAGRQREQLEARCQALLQQNETLQQQLTHLHSSSTDSSAELLKLSQQLLEHQQANEQLATKSSEERAALERQLQASQQRLDTLCAQVELLTQELAGSTEQGTQLQSKLKSEQELAAKQSLELSDANRKLEAAAARCLQLEQQQEKLQQELGGSRDEQSDLNTKWQQLKEQLATVQKELSSERDASSEQRLQLERQLEEVRQQLQSSQASMKENQDQLKGEVILQEQLKQLQKQLNQAQAEKEQQSTGNQVTIKELKERLEITNTELQHKEQLLSEDAQKITDLKTLVEAIQVANANISTTNAELSTVLEVLQAEKSETAHIFELFEMEADMNAERLIEKLQGMKQELLETHTQLDSQFASNKELQGRVEQFQKTEAGMQGTAVEAAEQLRQLQQANGELLEAVQQKQAMFNGSQAQLEAQLSCNKELQQQLLELKTTSATAAEQLQQVQTSNVAQEKQFHEQSNDFTVQLLEYQKVIDEMDEAAREKTEQLHQLQIQKTQLETSLAQARESERMTRLECQQLMQQLQELEFQEAREIVALRAQANGSMTSPTSSNNTAEQLDTETSLAKINFLNSIIADMQQKNDALKAKVQTLETLPLDFSKPNAFDLLSKRKPAPRLFCDICDEFDKHETEDCPLQAGEDRDYSPPPTAAESKNQKERKLPAPRKYCESCEVFGHDTSECADDETY